MSDEFEVTCPYCGEIVEIYLEPDVRGTFVQDCEVCCNPWRVRVSGSGDDRDVEVARADGWKGSAVRRRSGASVRGGGSRSPSSSSPAGRCRRRWRESRSAPA